MIPFKGPFGEVKGAYLCDTWPGTGMNGCRDGKGTMDTTARGYPYGDGDGTCPCARLWATYWNPGDKLKKHRQNYGYER